MIRSRAIGSVTLPKKKEINWLYIRKLQRDPWWLFHVVLMMLLLKMYESLFRHSPMAALVSRWPAVISSLIRTLWRPLSMCGFFCLFVSNPRCGVWRDYYSSAMRRLKQPASSLCQHCCKWAFANKKNLIDVLMSASWVSRGISGLWERRFMKRFCGAAREQSSHGSMRSIIDASSQIQPMLEPVFKHFLICYRDAGKVHGSSSAELHLLIDSGGAGLKTRIFDRKCWDYSPPAKTSLG